MLVTDLQNDAVLRILKGGLEDVESIDVIFIKCTVMLSRTNSFVITRSVSGPSLDSFRPLYCPVPTQDRCPQSRNHFLRAEVSRSPRYPGALSRRRVKLLWRMKKGWRWMKRGRT